jgi:ADP-heptose:LPS heptosyltransferase
METSGKEFVNADCRYFVGDRPCRFHKAEMVKCSDCPYYDPVETRILVIKLGAMGDVLRTTSILPTLGKRYSTPHITWVTRSESLDLLQNNPLVDSLMVVEGEDLVRLQVQMFDLVINPEAAKESAALASIARGKDKRGFGLSPGGFVFAFNRGAEEIFHLGLFDDMKRRNRKSYEELLCQLADLPYHRIPPMLRLTDDEIDFGKAFRKRRHIRRNRPVVGINTGGGGRWVLKRWTIEGFVELAGRLSERLEAQVLLLGGPAEVEINKDILSRLEGKAVDTGCFNSIRRFGALIGLCDVVVTGDSLALHMALALEKRVVALFGPTSAAEVDLYGMGKKITAKMDCLCCYREKCEKSQNCMESISAETVYQAVDEQIACLGGVTDEGVHHHSHI